MDTPPESPTFADPLTLAAKLKFLRGLSLFKNLSEPVLAKVAEAARPHVWPAGKQLFHRGDPSTYMIAIEQGHLRISLQTREGREFVLQHVRGGAIVGEVGLLDGSTRTADATAAADTRGYVIDRQRFERLSASHPELAQAAIRHLCALVRYTTDHIEAIALYGLEARLARFLLSSMEQTSAGDIKARPRFLLDLNQSEIADLIGSSRSKVNRALVALERRGVITRDGRTVICDRDRLSRMAARDDED